MRRWTHCSHRLLQRPKLPEGEQHRVPGHGGRPQGRELLLIYESLDVTGGTEVEHPEQGRFANTGVITRLDMIDVHVTRVSEDVTVRPPRAAEVEALSIESGVHVFCIQRTFSTDERPVEIADIIVPGDRYSLSYEFRVTDEDDPTTDGTLT
ncbi:MULTISPECIES: UTRA domain-containing protein [unclassified Streptomyces]|uniref:UTRA domain-containing protein n=1 Tax=unclassified Streptomyces TaxID=2593676 RepID=UPI00381BCE90